ncbi:flagellar basal body rod protein FlgB [Paenibacillus sp. J2TS4]|uniref:flagellar basal body rod protein FlgB n=1 Tax=Paenibacillus sp. J2TS4 TaxID=2807194 RepID=UPI001B020585|nr:flagellar basal body rod protein FlgB [Paenibacillus sp. J2TS4]GIP33061.1 flagellar basal body rod protein FlgB [Paenibacillus sp. J2TS4]
MVLLNSPTFNLMERSMDASALRHQVLSNNIANVDTPYFKRSEIKFEEFLQNEMRAPFSIEGFRTDPRHFVIGHSSQVSPQITTDAETAMNNNMNNVDIDAEMSLLAKNVLRYYVMSQQVGHEIKMARTALGGSSR